MKELCAFQPQRYWPGRWDKLEMTEPPAWLLLYLGADTGSYPMDLTRAMLGMFLIDQQVLDPPGEYYCFDAFENGPLSVEVGRDLRWLTFQNLIEQKTIAPGSDQRVYSLTDAGRAEYVRITQSRTSGQLRTIQEIATFVTSHRLSDILNRISQEYPYFAVGSVPLAPTGD